MIKSSVTAILAALIIFSAGCNNDGSRITPVRFGIQDLYYCFWDVGGLFPTGTIEEAHAMFDNLDDLRVKHIRYAVYWSLTERSPGVFDWSRHDDLIDFLTGKGLTVVINFHGGHDDYDGIGGIEASPYPGHPTVGYYDAWLSFVEKTVTRYRDRVSHYEIWNEPDLIDGGVGVFWKPVPNAIHFSGLASGTADKIKSLQPSATVISGGVTVFNGYRAFLKGCFDNGMLGHVDAVGIHPYRPEPEGGFTLDPDPSVKATVEEEIADLKNFIGGYKTGIPVWNTESGYINFSHPVDMQRAQARFVSRSVLVDQSTGMEGNMLFRLRYDPVVQPEFEGLIHEDPFQIRPAFTAYRNISRYLADASVTYVKSVRKILGGDSCRIEYYASAERHLVAYWMARPITNGPITLETVNIEIDGITPRNITIIDIMKEDTDPRPGYFEKTAAGVRFHALPVSDYPLILFADR
jgi:hypothetical protein